jgi:hypothetical protein
MLLRINLNNRKLTSGINKINFKDMFQKYAEEGHQDKPLTLIQPPQQQEIHPDNINYS